MIGSDHAFRFFLNPRVAPASPSGAEERAILGGARFAEARASIMAWPGYAPTPLRRLNGLFQRNRSGAVLRELLVKFLPAD